MEQAHNLGMRSSATMMFGHLEHLEHIIEHMERIRMLQDKTSGFTAFIPWTFQPGNTFFGANDMGSTMIEENVVASAGVHFMLPETELKRLISSAGFEPRQRDCYYNLL